jgi:hypothetical protein
MALATPPMVGTWDPTSGKRSEGALTGMKEIGANG